MQLHLLVCVLICGIQAAEIPSNFEKCNRNDPNLDKCLLEAVTDALPQTNQPYPEANLPTLDPLFVSELHTKTQQPLVDTEEYLYNCTFYGFPEGQPKQFSWDLENKVIRIKALFPKIECWCTYKIDGRILFFIIHSSGPSHLVFTNFDAAYNISYQEIVKDNKTYIQFDDGKFDGTLENVHFDVENVFPGWDLLTQFANFMLNLTWSILFQEVKTEYFDMADKQLLRPIFNGFFEVVSLEEALD